MKLIPFVAAMSLCAAGAVMAQNQSNQQSGQSAGQQRNGVSVEQNQTRAQKFSQMDKDKSGSISKAEGNSSPELIVIWSEVDTNGDGAIDAAEFKVVPLVQPDGTAAR
jgi:Ca2+-binding EF-hand superfamily protein